MERRIEFEDLLNHAGWLRALAASLVNDSASADDLVQDTWVAALRRPPGAEAAPWLARVMHNLARNRRRADSNRSAREREAGAERAQLAPETILEEAEAQRQLAEAVTGLAEPLRVVVVLRFFRGLDSAAIARELALPASTVRTRLGKALAELRAELDRRFDGGRSAWSALFVSLLAPRGALVPATAAGFGAPLLWTAAALAGLATFAWFAREPVVSVASVPLEPASLGASPAGSAADTELADPTPARTSAVAQREAASVPPPSEVPLTGVILVDGRPPLYELQLEFTRDADSPVSQFYGWMQGGVTPSASGAFDFGPVPVGWSGRLSVSGFLFEDGARSMPIRVPEKDLVVRLRRQCALTGQIRFAGPTSDTLAQPFVAWLTTQEQVRGELDENGEPQEVVLMKGDDRRRERCDEDGRFSIPLAAQGTVSGTLLFEVPGRWRRQLGLGSFSSYQDYDLGVVELEPARAQRFQLVDADGLAIPLGGAVVDGPRSVTEPAFTDASGVGELPSVELAGAPVRFFAPGYLQVVQAIVPGGWLTVRLERASCLELAVVCDEGKASSLTVVVTADDELFEDGQERFESYVQTGSSWTARRRCVVDGQERGIELHYPLPADGRLHLNELQSDLPIQLEVRDSQTHVLATQVATVAQGEWQRLELHVNAPPDPGPPELPRR